MKVVFRKPDLDTCLAALILGVGAGDQLRLAPDGAAPAELADPGVLCIEAGGSGQVELGNYDHHAPGLDLPPACVQAWGRTGRDPALDRLVRYTALVDEARPGAAVGFPSLSNVFSGMLLVTDGQREQFLDGIALLREVGARGYDPFAPLPEVAAWGPYIAAKHANRHRVEAALAQAVFFTTAGGRKAAYCASGAPGGIGALYARGCNVVIMHDPAWGTPPVPKYTIAGNQVAVAPLLGPLGACEPGWGGRATIIGSPPHGSILAPEALIDLVRRTL